MGFFGAISAVKTAIQVASSAMFIAADVAEFSDNVVRGVKAGWSGEDLEEEVETENQKTSEYMQRKPSDVAKAAYKIARFARNILVELRELFTREDEDNDDDGPVQLTLDNIVPFDATGET